MPTVSVIICFIDEYNLLHQAIASALAQRNVDIELIIVRNHPSPADTDKLPSLPPNTKVLHRSVAGSAYARNTGMQAATGTWLQFLDVDDLLLPDKISHQLFHAAADVVVSPTRFLHPSGKQERSKWLAEDAWSGLLNSGLGSTSSMLFKRDALLAIGGWNTGIQSHQEYDLLFRLMKAGYQLATLDRIETIVRGRTTGSITINSKSVRNEEGIELREQMWSWLAQHGMDTTERKDAFRQYIFKQLRGLYRKDKAQALKKYTLYFAADRFTPADMHIPGYGILYRLLGFALTEKLLLALVRMRRIR